MSLIYYHIPTDKIFMDYRIDAAFYFLMGNVKWSEIEILGTL